MPRFMPIQPRNWHKPWRQQSSGPHGWRSTAPGRSSTRGSSHGTAPRGSRMKSTRRLASALPTERNRAALVLAPETPYPLAGGGALRTASLLHYLAKSYEVDLLVFRQPGGSEPAEHLPEGVVRRICVLDLAPNGRSLAARVWRNAARVTRAAPP